MEWGGFGLARLQNGYNLGFLSGLQIDPANPTDIRRHGRELRNVARTKQKQYQWPIARLDDNETSIGGRAYGAEPPSK